MHRHCSFHFLSVALILALLLVPWVTEAWPSDAPGSDAAASTSIIDHFLGWLVALWGDVGCTVDPDGRFASGASTAPSGSEGLDNICTWDPNGGGCRESLNNGCTADPDGVCRDHG